MTVHRSYQVLARFLSISWILLIIPPIPRSGYQRALWTGTGGLRNMVKDRIAMKKIVSSLLPLVVLGCFIGCAHKAQQGCRVGCNGACNVCGMQGAGGYAMTANGQPCGPLGGGGFHGGQGGRCIQNPRAYVGAAGPPTAAVTYPYYTTRGPRDFLLDQPLTIGP